MVAKLRKPSATDDPQLAELLDECVVVNCSSLSRTCSVRINGSGVYQEEWPAARRV